MPDILAEIAAYKREVVARARYECPLLDVQHAAGDAPEASDFAGALRNDDIALIAEVKKASPSQGVIRADFEPERIAAAYVENGARALSVLTDEAYFQGSDAHLIAAREVCDLPVLRKDFTVDEYQIFQARVLGADAVLLIVALMDGSQLEDCLGHSRELGMSALVEVHTQEELARAVSVGAELVGINNRDLKTFVTNLDTTFELLPGRPPGALVVSESGIKKRQDVERLQSAGVDAMLVGELLMRQSDIGAGVRDLLGI